jgi:nicotinic acid mononucleotide adenylyltransferase
MIQRFHDLDRHKKHSTISVLNREGQENELKSSLPALVSSSTKEETSIKIALAGINRTGLRSSVFVSAPPDRLELPT